MNRKEIIIIVVVVLILFILLFTFANQSRENGRRTACASHLSAIGLACRMYSTELKGPFPSDDGVFGFERLRAGGYLENTKMYTCPSTKDEIAENAEITPKNTSYIYIGGADKLTEDSDEFSSVAWDKQGNHSRYGNILTINGWSQGYSGGNWMNNIKRADNKSSSANPASASGKP